jgi:hypothetical protein
MLVVGWCLMVLLEAFKGNKFIYNIMFVFPQKNIKHSIL